MMTHFSEKFTINRSIINFVESYNHVATFLTISYKIIVDPLATEWEIRSTVHSTVHPDQDHPDQDTYPDPDPDTDTDLFKIIRIDELLTPSFNMCITKQYSFIEVSIFIPPRCTIHFYTQNFSNFETGPGMKLYQSADRCLGRQIDSGSILYHTVTVSATSQ